MPRLVVLSFLCSFLFPYSLSSFLKNCPPEKFQCEDGECIPLGDHCDHFPDCTDGSDEKDCSPFLRKYDYFDDLIFGIPKFPLTITCDKNEYKCKEINECIPLPKFCDSVKDCIDGSDEYDNCTLNLNCSNRFRCNDQHCISNDWVCDGIKDCLDGSDELNCANKTSSASDCKIKSQYLCENQRCIPFNAVCNKKDDCGDGSDEGAKCTLFTCPSAKCEHECKQTPKGSVCICKPGYKLQDDNRTCKDIDECQIYGVCDQQCVNSVGSYSCKCKKNYFLQDDKKTCKAQAGEATLVFSIKTKIIGMYVDSKINFTLASKLNRATSVTMNGREHIYWSDIEKDSETIVRSIPGNSHEVIVTTGLSMISGIAVDWVTENIYFTDEEYNHIGVCNNDGTSCTVLIIALDKPTGITLLPSRGEMYWSEGGTYPRIAVAGMDGKNIRTLVSKDLEWPRSITIDYPNERLYWVDSKLKLAESIRLDGTDRRLILHDVIQEPFSLAVFENTLYWSDSGSNTIQSCNKFSGKDWRILYRTHDKPYGIHIDHSAIKPKIDNPCKFNLCSELCLLNQNKGYTCACTLDKKLNADYHTCQELKEKQHLLIFAKKALINYYHGLLGKPKVTNTSNLKLCQVVSDPSSGQVIISSQPNAWYSENELKRYDPVNNTFKNITTTDILNDLYQGLAFDYIGNNLYMSNAFGKSIEVLNERTLAKTVFYFEDHPTSITLAPEESKMFVTFRKPYVYLDNYLSSMYEMRMDGLGERKLLKDDLNGPRISMYYDRDSKTLFVGDEYSGSILSHSNEGMRVLRTGLNSPVSLTVAGDNIFWMEAISNAIYWTNFKNIFSNHKDVAFNVPKDYLFYTFPFVVTLRKDAKQEHDCQKNNGNCSHVCLPSVNTSFICACPPGMELSNNNRNCILSPCPKNKYKCSGHDICVEKEKLCDGVVHCPDGDDEMTGDCKSKRCKEDQFMCKNGECISSKDRCNSHFDCTDRSDEEHCENPTCKSDEFQCRDGTCILSIDVCDFHIDCPDFSDEINCNSRSCATDEFKCNGGKCIPKDFVCDDEFDCPDGEDEADDKCKNATKAIHSCSDGYFRCTNGICLALSLRCNGYDDCLDESDERDCPNKPGHLVNCTLNQYHCFNTDICLPKNVRCDGQNDCPGRDDEHDCSFCFKDEFTCDNQHCIPEKWVCDKTDDCDDGSDEKNCNGAKEIINKFNKCDEFKCSIGTCLPYSKVCDGTRDCPDGSDENGKCQIACTMINYCKDICYKTPTGPICGCPNGYRLASDAISCEDINECEQNVCSQNCRNTLGSYQCSCQDGYIIRNDKVSCKALGPAMKFITVTDVDIRIMSMSSNLHSLSVEVLYPLTDSSLNSLDINAVHNSVYWSNDEFGYIKKYNIRTKKLINTMFVEHPQSLAVDWITDNVYVIDNGRPNTIKVCDLEKQRCATLVKIEDNAKAIYLVVDPINKWLFWVQITWTQINQPLTKIYRADMTGADMKIINSHVGFVTGMAIDYIKSKLYWLDNFQKTIEFSNLDGSQHTMFLSTSILHHPSDISIFEQTLWTIDFNGLQLQSCKLYGKKSCETVHIGINNVYTHFTILHTSRQPSGKNPCDEEHCDYMCVQKKDNATCVCSDGKPIKSNNICTINESKFATKSTSLSRNARHTSGIYSVTIIVLLVGVVLLCVYYYYQRNKLKLKPATDLSSCSSIRFQNPSYDRSDEVEVVLNSVVSDLAPGQHEYVNPIDDKFFTPTMECCVQRSNKCSEEKDVEETKKENALIYLAHTK